MSLNDELTALEAVINESEKMLADGSLDVDMIEKQIKSVTDPNAMIAQAGKWIGILKDRIDKINIVRMKELKYQHPNDSRISQLGSKAAKCFFALNSIWLDVSDRLASPDVRAEQKIQNQQVLNGLKMMFADLLQ